MPLERRGFAAEVMKHPPLYTLVLLAVGLQSGTASDGDGQCVPVFVRIEETAVIECSIRNTDQDGVYLYRQLNNNIVEKMMYYYKDGTFSPDRSFTHRLQTNKDLGNFSVSLNNVSKHDGGVYWCKFNKFDVCTASERKCLLVQSGQILMYEEKKCQQDNFIYLGVIGGLSSIILVLLIVLVKLCYHSGSSTPKLQQQQQQQQQPCNDVYEVMCGNTKRSLFNPAYESSQRQSTLI